MAALAPTCLSAQGHPIAARGFTSQSAFSSDGIDSVNLFSRNLVLSLPIGQSYPLGPNLAYGLTLYYNSNVWDPEIVQSCNPDKTPCVRVEPGASFNAGLGWTLSLGRLLSPNHVENESSRWLYIGPDSSRHYFYDTLHEGEVNSGGCTSDGCAFQYTRDGSYLRFKKSTLTIEFADGSTHTFGGSNGELTRLEDRFGNYLNVTVNANNWQLSDRHGRSHTVNFTTVANKKVVSSVTLASFAGGTTTWSFAYNPTAVYRPYMDSDESNPDQVTVPLLYDITATAGSAPSVNYSMWQSGAPSYFTGSLNTNDPTGQLRRIVLPTKGTIEWTYGLTHYPVAGDWTQFENGFGVATKTTGNNWGTGGTWSYSSALYPATNSTELQTTVTTPANTSSVHYFSVPTTVSSSGWTGWEFGLPFTARFTSGGRNLSSETYSSTGALVRSQYVSFTHDKLPTALSPGDWYNSNRRVSGSRTNFNDDGGKYIDRAFADFDGVGNFRDMTHVDNFDGTTSRTETTEFNSSRGCYDINLSTNTQLCTGGSTFVPFSTGDPWVLGTFAYRQQTEGGVTARQEASFTTAGFLDCVRVLKNGTTRNANDVVTTFSNNGSGFPSFEKYWGGDDQSLSTGTLCATASQPAYWVDHTYASGVRSSSRFKSPSGTAMNFYAFNAAIDNSTGMIRDSYDPSGYWTRFTFDGFGRPTLVEPLGSTTGEKEAKVALTYSNASGGTAAKVNIYRSCPTGVSGCSGSFGETEAHFDGFGRAWKSLARQDDGSTWARRETTYNALGWRTGTSELGASTGALSWNTFTQFDSFGRPGKLTKADGKIVNFSYAGIRDFSRTVKVYTTQGAAEVDSTTTWRNDGLGRLRKVFEPAMPNGTNVNTTYSYDVGNRLKQVQQSAGTNQNRYFTYDNRGFLTSEQHPEKGASGNGTVSYLSYDALGNASEIRDGSASNNLLFTFDAAARLLTIAEGGAGGRMLKEFTYGSSGSSLARVVTAKRHNYLPAPIAADYSVTETYVYDGVGRRPSSRTTQTNYCAGTGCTPVNQEYFVQSWIYDRGGSPTSTSYPRCYGGACPAGGTAARTESATYSYGWLTSIPGWASDIDYHLNGMVSEVDFAGINVSETIVNDPNSIARPQEIKFTQTSSGSFIATTGVYSYDSSGNIKAIDSGHFLYDAASRLTSGTVLVAGLPKTQSATYDGFGNITSITTNGTLRNTPTSASTNRLSSASYDAAGAGNLTAWNGATYAYDRLNMMYQLTNGSENWIYAYTADDERILQYRIGGGSWQTAIRDLDGKILREYRTELGGWTAFEDYVYRDGALLASVHPTEGTRWFGIDHLGSPRIRFNTAGAIAGVHTYYPFGEEATPGTGDTQQMKFTGHERDMLNTPTGFADDTDYMHARQFSPLTGRFTATDRHSGHQLEPSTWNRYSYAQGNPLRFVDPDGLDAMTFIQRLRRGSFMPPTQGSLSFHLDMGSGVGGSTDFEILPELEPGDGWFGFGFLSGAVLSLDVTVGYVETPDELFSVTGGDFLGFHFDRQCSGSACKYTLGLGLGGGAGFQWASRIGQRFPQFPLAPPEPKLEIVTTCDDSGCITTKRAIPNASIVAWLSLPSTTKRTRLASVD
ncbi:MAG: RHS repeat-associated core domain-containing protein [Thermoanaerobaculia bacterium]